MDPQRSSRGPCAALGTAGSGLVMASHLGPNTTVRNRTLRQLYEGARGLGDQLGVRRWSLHHLRVYDEMFDAAANAAFDTNQSSHSTSLA
jgi:hypothetical protein